MRDYDGKYISTCFTNIDEVDDHNKNIIIDCIRSSIILLRQAIENTVFVNVAEKINQFLFISQRSANNIHIDTKCPKNNKY